MSYLPRHEDDPILPDVGAIVRMIGDETGPTGTVRSRDLLANKVGILWDTGHDSDELACEIETYHRARFSGTASWQQPDGTFTIYT